MKYTDLSCIRCGTAVEPSLGKPAEADDDWAGWDDVPPADALLFTSYGNYGSTVYDPCDQRAQEYLTIVLCDECAVAQAHAGNVMHVCKPLPQPPTPPRYRGPWQPSTEEEQ